MKNQNLLHKFEVYVPENDAPALKNALAAAGAGRLGNYDSCFWETAGTGQFRPLPGSSPAISEGEGKICQVREIKIEFIAEAEFIPSIIEAIKQNHPYETPAFSYWPVQINQSSDK